MTLYRFIYGCDIMSFIEFNINFIAASFKWSEQLRSSRIKTAKILCMITMFRKINNEHFALGLHYM